MLAYLNQKKREKIEYREREREKENGRYLVLNFYTIQFYFLKIYLSQLKATERLFLLEKIAQGRRNSNEGWNRRESLDNPATSLKLDYPIPTLLRVVDFDAVLLIKETSHERNQVITRLLEKASRQLAHDWNCRSYFFGGIKSRLSWFSSYFLLAIIYKWVTGILELARTRWYMTKIYSSQEA